MSDPKQNSRLRELDALRGLAALAVVICHYSSYCYRYFDAGWSFHFGSYGAHLFFVISGFVIFMTLGRCKSACDFIFSRFSRLYPTYWLAVLFSTAVVLIFNLPKFDVSLTNVLGNLTMCQTWLKIPDIEAAYWTLGVELKFYGLMLAFFLLSRRLGSWFSIEKATCLWLTGIVAFRWVDHSVGLPHALSMPLILDYAHLFIAGIMFFQLRNQGSSWLRHTIIAAAIPMQFLAEGSEATCVTTGFLFVFYLVNGDRLRFIASRPLIYLGNISYPLYLIHGAMGYVIIRQMAPHVSSVLLLMVVPMLATIGVSHVITYHFDRPVLQCMRSWYQRKKDELQEGTSVLSRLIAKQKSLG